MTDTTLINCDAVLGTFRQWQAEQEPIDAQLSESLSALSAYQSHLDDWQQQLARERDELRASREQWERERSAAAQSLNTDTSSLVAVELNAARDEVVELTAALNSQIDEFTAVREQADFNQSRLTEVTEELSVARGEIAKLTKSLLTSAEELRAERQKIEDNVSSADLHQSQLAEVSAELNAARDKISALTTTLLSRTEELRTLDALRAEAGAELEMARVRERELKTALEELRQASEWEQAQWADESRQLREMIERRLEEVDPDSSTDRANSSQSEARREKTAVECTAENPVFASVKEQFGKLRQQRAMDRPASKKAR